MNNNLDWPELTIVCKTFKIISFFLLHFAWYFCVSCSFPLAAQETAFSNLNPSLRSCSFKAFPSFHSVFLRSFLYLFSPCAPPNAAKMKKLPWYVTWSVYSSMSTKQLIRKCCTHYLTFSYIFKAVGCGTTGGGHINPESRVNITLDVHMDSTK